MKSYIQVVVIFGCIFYSEGGCLWPTTFRSTTWRDNTRGDLTFLTTTMTGFSFTSYGTNINNWECLDNSTFSSDGVLMIKSTDTITVAGATYVTYVCLKTTQVVVDVSYYYYQMHEQQPNAAYERVLISIDGSLTDRATICSASTVPAAEFHFMLKAGSESSAKQYCPSALLAKMDYVYTSDTGSTECGSSTDNWDVCTDRQVMTFDYNTCTQQMAYSSNGVVWCVGGITSTYEYVVVYNTDSNPTYRFTCFVVSSDGLTASMVFNNCSVTQTPTSYAKTSDGTTNVGALLTMTKTETCPFTTTSTSTASTHANTGATTATPTSGESSEGGGGGGSNTGAMAAGAGVGLLAIIAIGAVTVYFLKRKKANNGVSHTDIEKIVPADAPETNGHAVTAIENPNLTANPALTANPERNILTPLPPKTEIIQVSGQKLPPIRGQM